MHHKAIYRGRARQQGATMVIALLVLVLIMMLGITAVSTSNTQYKLAGNIQFEDAALNRTETAVATAENWLQTNFNNPGFFTTQVTGLLQIGAANTPFAMAWDNSDSIAVGGDAGERYTIQVMSTSNALIGSSAVIGRTAAAVCNSVNTYLITARGTFARGASKIVQSYYSVLNCTGT